MNIKREKLPPPPENIIITLTEEEARQLQRTLYEQLLSRTTPDNDIRRLLYGRLHEAGIQPLYK